MGVLAQLLTLLYTTISWKFFLHNGQVLKFLLKVDKQSLHKHICLQGINMQVDGN